MIRARLKAAALRLLSPRLPWRPRVSYSQFGEDCAVRTLVRYCGLTPGFYLDVGAYHPVSLSNTYGLYLDGWSGVTVEPDAAAAPLFRTVRPRDAHLAVVATPDDPPSGAVDFFTFPAAGEYSTLSRAEADRVSDATGLAYTAATLPARSLNRIVEDHLPPGRWLDVLCLDCEGADEALLRSLDWDRHRPAVVVFEQDGVEFSDIPALPVVGFLGALGYSLYAKCGASFVAHLPRDLVRARREYRRPPRG
jgi:hypothetical protein